MEKFYSDIDLRFQAHPLTKDLIKLEDGDAVKQSIKNIVLTNKKEKRFDSLFGGNLRNYLFENIDTLYLDTIKEDIILTTIEETDINSLIQIIKNKYVTN